MHPWAETDWQEPGCTQVSLCRMTVLSPSSIDDRDPTQCLMVSITGDSIFILDSCSIFCIPLFGVCFSRCWGDWGYIVPCSFHFTSDFCSEISPDLYLWIHVCTWSGVNTDFVFAIANLGVEGLVLRMDLQVVDWGWQSRNGACRGIAFVLYLWCKMKPKKCSCACTWTGMHKNSAEHCHSKMPNIWALKKW